MLPIGALLSVVGLQTIKDFSDKGRGKALKDSADFSHA